MNTLDVIASNGIPFRIVYLAPGEIGPFPSAFDPVHALVEIFDQRFPFTTHGQFVSRYRASTLTAGDVNVGLNMHTGVAAWNIDANAMNLIRLWIMDQS